MPLHNFTK